MANRKAIIQTKKGSVTVGFDEDKTPITASRRRIIVGWIFPFGHHPSRGVEDFLAAHLR